MNVAAVMADIATALDTIPDLRAYPYPVDRVVPPVALVELPEEITYDQTFGRGSDSMTIPVAVCVSAQSARSSTEALAAYLDGWGVGSVKGAIEGHNFTTCDSARVTSARVEPIQVADMIYNGATFTIEVTGRGGV